MTTAAIFQEPSAHPLPMEPEPPSTPPEQLDADAPTAEAPYGWTTDSVTGERRPKKTAGRRARGAAKSAPSAAPPSLEELRAGALSGGDPREDVAPIEQPARRRVQFSKKKPAAAAAPAAVPPFRAGPIAAGVNKLYRRAGKLIKIWDVPLGVAVIATTVQDEDDPDALTVGQAWEEIARFNPRVRAFLLKIMTGNAWNQLFIAHLPILIAIAIKDSVRSRLPFQRIVNALLTDDPAGGGDPSDLSGMLGGINPEDFAQMMAMAQMMAAGGGMAFPDLQRGMNTTRPADEGWQDTVAGGQVG